MRSCRGHCCCCCGQCNCHLCHCQVKAFNCNQLPWLYLTVLIKYSRSCGGQQVPLSSCGMGGEQCLRGCVGVVVLICPYSLSSRLIVTDDGLVCLGGIRSEIDRGNGDRRVKVVWLWTLQFFHFWLSPSALPHSMAKNKAQGKSKHPKKRQLSGL